MAKRFLALATVVLLAGITAISGNVPLPPSLQTCSEDVAQGQAAAFSALSNARYWSDCPTDGYLTHLHRIARGGQRNIIDVGANKGYTAAKLFQRWAPNLNLSPPILHNFYKTEEKTGEIGNLDSYQACGACDDCKEGSSGGGGGSGAAASHPSLHPSGGPDHTALHVYSYEPAADTFQLASRAVRHFFPGQVARFPGPEARGPARASGGLWHLQQAAVGHREGVLPWSLYCRNEQCSQAMFDERGMVDVNLTTVDAIVRQHGLAHVDFLKVDTEGFDPLVLRGASASLTAQTIGLLMFEYNLMGLWHNTTRLKTVVDDLAGYGYVCYMAGRPTLSRMTRCWSELYERRQWSNVLCTTERHFAHFEAQSFVGHLKLS